MADGPLTKSAVRALEGKIDAAFEATVCPGEDVYTARWQMCQYVEARTIYDIIKMLSLTQDRRELGGFFERLDVTKYALQHALQLIDKKLSVKVDVRVRPGNFDRQAASELFRRGIEYADVYKIFPPVHKGVETIVWDGAAGAFEILVGLRTLQYWALENLLHIDADEFNPIIELLLIFSGPDGALENDEATIRWSPLIHDIVSRVSLKRGRLQYQLIRNFALELVESFLALSTPPLLDWEFPWCTMAEAKTYFAALHAICVYHLTSIHFGAKRLRVPTLGEQQRVYLTTAADLNSEIARLCPLTPAKIAKLTEVLTFGHETTTPDPALQPFIPVGADKLALPGTFILSNKWHRNLLSLHNRVAKDDFDGKTHVCEHKMIAELSPAIPGCWRSTSQIHLPTQPDKEEIDLILIDETTRCLLLVELKWTLQPGDIGQILRREEALQDKVDQVYRKLIRTRETLDACLCRLKCAGEGWTVEAMVVVEGFRGIPSPMFDTVPVVPAAVLVAALDHFTDLRRFHATFCTDDWLPREGADIDRVPHAQTLFGHVFNRHGFEIGKASYLRESLSRYLKEGATPAA